MFDRSPVKVEIITRNDPDQACLAFSGNWSKLTGAHHEADELIERVKNQSCTRMLLDLNDLEDVNSKFISMLVLLLESEKEVSLKSPSRFLEDLLEMVGIKDEFREFDDRSAFFDVATADTGQAK